MLVGLSELRHFPAMRTDDPVLVIGAGLGWLTAAIAPARAWSMLPHARWRMTSS